MPKQPSDAEFAPTTSEDDTAFHPVRGNDVADTQRLRSKSRADWRLGGRSVRRWDLSVLALGCMSAAAGAILSVIIERVWPSWPAGASLAALWGGMAAGLVFAFARARPVGLLRVDPTDVGLGLGFGVILRVTQGWLSGPTAFPSMGSYGSSPLSERFISSLLSTVIGAPLIEELFFRGLILVALYQLFRRSVGALAAAITATLGSAGLFVVLHAVFVGLSPVESVQLTLLGVVCAGLVFVTGRVWAAVLAHAVYNGTFLILSALGTALS